MKFLRAAFQFVILGKCVTASIVRWNNFCTAIDEGELETALDLCTQGRSLFDGGVCYVIEKQKPDFIADFINQTNQANEDTLSMLCGRRSAEDIEKVLEKVDFPQKIFVEAASEYASGCEPEKFRLLFNKIEALEDQESAVEKGFGELMDYDDPTKCLAPLLAVIREKTSLSKHLEDIAIKAAFKRVAEDLNETFIRHYFDHPAITHEVYAEALIINEKNWGSYKEHQCLLERADRYDLLAVKHKPGYQRLGSNFRIAIDEALKTAAPGGTRTHNIERTERTKKEFMTIVYPAVIFGVADIIGEYLNGYKEREGVLQKQGEDVERGVGDKVAKKRKMDVAMGGGR